MAGLDSCVVAGRMSLDKVEYIFLQTTLIESKSLGMLKDICLGRKSRCRILGASTGARAYRLLLQPPTSRCRGDQESQTMP